MRRRWLALIVHPRDVLSSAQTLHAIDRAALSNALDLVQIRATEDDTRDDVTAATQAVAHALTRDGCEARVRLVVNHDALAMAASSSAHGWHMKERSLSSRPLEQLRADVQEARRLGMLTGCSVHSVETASRAVSCGVDYVQVGTMFSTPSHPEKHVAELEGPELLSQIRAKWRLATSTATPPVIAVGGINTQEHVHRVLAAGGDGVAVIRGILASADPLDAALQYRQWLEEYTP